jgi:ribosome-associated protein
MLKITPSFSLDENELSFDFVRAAGPGGQNVNKVASAVQLRFNVLYSPSLPADVKERLLRMVRSRLTQSGELIIEAKRYRTQEQNRLDAQERLVALLQKAFIAPKNRLPTRPGTAARERRLESKKRRSAIKRVRQIHLEHSD